MVIQKSRDGTSRIITSHSETFSRGSHFSEIRGGGNKLHPIKYTEKNHRDFLYELHGRDMGRLVFQELDGFLFRAFSPIGMKAEEVIEDVSGVAMHQVSPSFVRLLRKRLNLGDKVIDCTSSYGNMLSVSVPLMIDELITSWKVSRGDRILIFGGGSGITLGTMYLQY
jgi:3-oxoacyl-[acyl-carrier-protein] synthase-3